MSADSAGAPVLAARSLCLERGGRELFHDLSFDICAGQLWQIEGANGAGKTSLLRILCGLSRYGFDGQVERHVPLLYLGHQSALKALLTPRENLAFHVSGDSRYEDEKIESALSRVGLYGYEDVASHTLSAGQHRRVNLARLLLSDAPLWLLDEPFTAIDKAGVEELEALLVSQVAAGGSVVMTSHQTLNVDCDVRFLNLTTGLVA
ncbi:Cytochrome c biogenesis ATP-binding export protein CcmA [Halioglobus japonicus]|nr:Cytochrome c biogenesis ATP-binding export protein CcmA [Halioglobus japonicus]